MSLNYGFIDTLKLLMQSFKYNIFISIIVSLIILTIIFIINKNKKVINCVILGLNIVLIFIICIYYIKDILNFNFRNPLNNIYFYFFNSILHLIIMSIYSFKTKRIIVNYIFYDIALLNLLFSLYMTYYLNNVSLIVIGNIYPMIKFGNIIYIVFYIYVIIDVIFSYRKKKSL